MYYNVIRKEIIEYTSLKLTFEGTTEVRQERW